MENVQILTILYDYEGSVGHETEPAYFIFLHSQSLLFSFLAFAVASYLVAALKQLQVASFHSENPWVQQSCQPSVYSWWRGWGGVP